MAAFAEPIEDNEESNTVSEDSSDENEEENKAWRALLQQISRAITKAPENTSQPKDLLNDPHLQTHILEPLRVKLQNTVEAADIITASEVYTSIDDTISELVEQEYSEDEAKEAAWDTRKYLVKKQILEPNIDLFSHLYEDEDQEEGNEEDMVENDDDASEKTESDGEGDEQETNEEAHETDKEESMDTENEGSDDDDDDDDSEKEQLVWRHILLKISFHIPHFPGNTKNPKELLYNPHLKIFIIDPLRKMIDEFIAFVNVLKASSVYEAIEDTAEKLEGKEGFSEEEAAEAAWETRKFLIKHEILKPNLDLFEKLYDDNDDENDEDNDDNNDSSDSEET